MVIDDEIRELFDDVRLIIGGGVRKVELTDEAMCVCLKFAVGDYAERVQNFVIENNWASMYGKNMSNIDLAYAMSVRTLDIMKDYSSWFSKQVGLQANGQWELKKDYFEIEKGKQVYMIPAGREINKVLWITPPTTDSALFANYGGFGVAFGGGVVGQMGLGAATVFGGMGHTAGYGSGLWALPSYDVSLLAADLKYKQQLFRSDLTYKVTAGPDGTHLIHLLSTPGSKLNFGAGAYNGAYGLAGCQCWYTYYDVTPDNVDDCRRQNQDVLLTPDQVPLNKMEFSMLNEPTKITVRNLFLGKCLITLGSVLGKFNGNINAISSPVTIDYHMYTDWGNKERDKALEDIDKRLEKLSPYYVMEKQKELVDNMIAAKKGVPLGIYIK